MRWLVVFLYLTFSGCTSWIPNLAFGDPDTRLRVIESVASHARRKAELRCSDGRPRDTVDYHGRAKATAPDWVHTNGHVTVPATALCRALIDDPPKVGCPCTPNLCIELGDKPICEPERWLGLIDESLWSNAALMAALQQHPPRDGLRVRWTAPNQVVIDRGPSVSRVDNGQWRLRLKNGEQVRCDGAPTLMIPGGSSATIALVETPLAGCRFVEGVMQVSSIELAQAEAIVVTADFWTAFDWTKEGGLDLMPVEMTAPRPVGKR